jgi:hypothetical protein
MYDQAPFHGMNPGQLMTAKLLRPTAEMLPLPDWVPRGLADLCHVRGGAAFERLRVHQRPLEPRLTTVSSLITVAYSIPHLDRILEKKTGLLGGGPPGPPPDGRRGHRPQPFSHRPDGPGPGSGRLSRRGQAGGCAAAGGGGFCGGGGGCGGGDGRLRRRGGRGAAGVSFSFFYCQSDQSEREDTGTVVGVGKRS